MQIIKTGLLNLAPKQSRICPKYVVKPYQKSVGDTFSFGSASDKKVPKPNVNHVSDEAQDAVNKITELMKQQNRKTITKKGYDSDLLIARLLPDNGFQLIITDQNKEKRKIKDTVTIIVKDKTLTVKQKYFGEKATIVSMDHLVNGIVNSFALEDNLRTFFLKK